MKKNIKSISNYTRINVIPKVRGQRAFPTRHLRAEDTDPFLMLDHIGPQKMPTDFHVGGPDSVHPHRGFETITFMFDGIMKHVDSIGNKALLEKGSVQRMNAGKGILHGGDMLVSDQTQIFHEMQLWLNVPSQKKMSQPMIQNITGASIPEVHYGEAKVRVIAGNYGIYQGPIQPTTPIVALHILTAGTEEIKMSIPKGYNSFLYAMDGTISIDNTEVSAFDTVHFDKEGTEFTIQSEGKGEVLVFAGKPINEPVVFGGPFVMNTQDEIEQAYADYSAGKFGRVR